ncbi:hypothetical protein TD95_004318 [Thielaviopsis punctulata]|uniref:chitinase n=1 Tax=Thielaviopsis punctulata TaxID=72032 RepID=A0A0F4ZGF1_9PEZI|nr:hypothetical protein TD95_004318 [Thielaviopsis punctulata]
MSSSDTLTDEQVKMYRKAVFRSDLWPKMKVNAIYYATSTLEDLIPPTELDYSYLNHINYGFSRLQPDGSILLGNEFIDCEIPVMSCTGYIGALLSMKKTYPYLRVCLTVGGAESDENFRIVAGDCEKRKLFAQAAVEIVRSSGLDGIDIAWRYPSSPTEGRDLVALLREIYEQFKADDYIITVLLPGSRAVLDMIDLSEMSKVVDLLNLACYNFFERSYDDGPLVSCHASQLNSANKESQTSVTSIVRHVLSRGVPPQKILLGVPAYGQKFQDCTVIGSPCTGWELVKYRNIPKNGTELYYPGPVAATCLSDHGNIISYDNLATVKKKAEFCLNTKLAGMFYWTGLYDSRTSSNSLMKAGFDVLHMDPTRI